MTEADRPGAGDPFAYVDLARLGRNQPWRYLAGIALVAAAFLLAGGLVVGVTTLLDITDMASVLLVTTAASLLLGVAVGIAVRLLHGRPVMSLVSPDLRLDGRRLAIGAVAWILVALPAPALALLAAGDAPALKIDPGLLAFAIGALLLVPFQAASEELIFRGYLTQGLGQLVRHRGAVALLVALPFAALHGQLYGPLSIVAYVLLSLSYSAVSLGDGRLELAIGAHAANNLIAFLAARASTGPSLLTGEPEAITLPAIAATLLQVVLFSLLALWLARRLPARPASASSPRRDGP